MVAEGTIMFRVTDILPVLLVLCYQVDLRAQTTCESSRLNVVRVEAGSLTGAGLVIGVDNGTATILTAYHVVKGAPAIRVTFWQQSPRNATLGQHVEALDLATLQVAYSGPLPAVLFSEDSFATNEVARPLGHPPGVPWQCGNEVVTRTSL